MSRYNIVLIVTGSVAAVKTFLLLKDLMKIGFPVTVVVTEAGWPFIEGDSKYKGSLRDISDLKSRALSEKSEEAVLAIAAADAVLIAPASADFISQIVFRDTRLGQALGDLKKPLAIAPAMNFMMWQHPAVQKNISALIDRGAVFFGPLRGAMACGDFGFGRFADSQYISDSLTSVLAGKKWQESPSAHKDILPQKLLGTCRKILWVVAGALPEQEIYRQVDVFKKKGWSVQVVLSEKNAAGVDVTGIEKVTGYPVSWRHHQLYPKDGMEHIWLAEDSDVVIINPLDGMAAAEMARGAARTFIGCLYLASKRPVIVVTSDDVGPQDIAALRDHGAFLTGAEGITAAIENLATDTSIHESGLRGRHFLVIGGNPRESVDSFRFYKNRARDDNHGVRFCKALIGAGATVDYLSADGSAREVLEACKVKASGSYDAVISMACVSQLMCATPVSHKIQKSGPERSVLFDVVGNVDFLSGLQAIFGEGRVIGYDNMQRWISPVLPFASKLASLSRRTGQVVQENVRKDLGVFYNAIVTTGRTEEILTTDGVVITNGFTGQQGQEIARSLADAGYSVLVISGPTSLPDVDHESVKTVHVRTMTDMMECAIAALHSGVEIFISAAAVADFSVSVPLDMHLDPGETRSLPMIENSSIVGAVARHATLRPKRVISFAAQAPDTLLNYATEKFKKLGVDMTVANPIGKNSAITRDTHRNQITLIYRNGDKIMQESLPEMSKADAAKAIVGRITGSK